MTLASVPVIDIGPYLRGTREGKSSVAKAVNQACQDIGFLMITGHGIAPDLIDRVDAAARSFFALPLEQKMEVKQPAPHVTRGYSAVGKEGLSYSLGEASPGDLKESFTIGPVDVPEDGYFRRPEAGQHFAPNLWPTCPQGFQGSWVEYYRAMSGLSAKLMRIFALALELPEFFFDDKIDRHISCLRVISYPNQVDEPLPGQLRAGAHSDYGSLTILRQEDRPGGLQVRNHQGEWVDAQPAPGSFTINIGDLMMQWTNDRWISNVHRVVNPPKEKAHDALRQSIVFFHQPNYDAVISCIPSCETEMLPAKYEPITSGDHLLNKFVKTTTFGDGNQAAI